VDPGFQTTEATNTQVHVAVITTTFRGSVGEHEQVGFEAHGAVPEYFAPR
jgi:L-amino acid N-acyltransferase YncA